MPLLMPDDDELLRSVGVNPLRCIPGRGVQVWGARTLAADPAECFVANRRLVHRLVRAMRQAAEPLVFEPNDHPLWLALNRALTSVLVEAWRSGALRGTTPAEAFAVRCDETTADVDDGSVVAEVGFVPAWPMERITLRILVGAEGNVEVIER
jgi:phage tail sheath protein FI